jgi:hypothetical protein
MVERFECYRAARAVSTLAASWVSARKLRWINAKAPIARAAYAAAPRGLPVTSAPPENTAEYTATTPAAQLTHERTPPGIGSFPNPSRWAIVRHPAPPGRTRR